MVCDNQFQVALIGTIYMLGLFCGSFIWGTLGDIIGRKLTLMLAITTGSLFSLIGAFFNNYYYYAFTRFMCAVGLYIHHYILKKGLVVKILGWTNRTHSKLVRDFSKKNF